MVMQRVAVAIIRNGDKILAAQRSKNSTLPGRWHLPGGKVEEHETLVDAVIRELKEELGIIPFVGEKLATVNVSFAHGDYEVHFFRIPEFSGIVKNQKNSGNSSLNWFTLYELDLDDLDNWLEVDKCVARLALLEGMQK